MGNSISDRIEKLKKLFFDKASGYLDLMSIAGCTDEEKAEKLKSLEPLTKIEDEIELSKILEDDMIFLSYFTAGGISSSDGKYDGLNKELTHTVMCDMASMKPNVKYPDEYIEEIDSPLHVIYIKDKVVQDMTTLFPDIKKMFLLGQKELFDERMRNLFGNNLDRFCEMINASVYLEGKSDPNEYKDKTKVEEYDKLFSDAYNKSVITSYNRYLKVINAIKYQDSISEELDLEKRIADINEHPKKM